MRMTRALAWVCVLAVLFAVAMPAAAGPPAILAAPGPVVDRPSGSVRLRATGHTAAPDPRRAAAVPARAPPLA